MNKYILVDKLEDGKVKIDINQVDGSDKGYRLYFNESNGAMQFIKNLQCETKILSDVKVEYTKIGSVLFIQFSNKEKNEYKMSPKYSVVLDNCSWVDKHIEDIKNQLFEQAEQMEFEIKLQKDMKVIEDAIRTQGYATLIQNMIKQYANQLTDMEIMDIQRTLTDVKEEKGLTPRQTYRFGL